MHLALLALLLLLNPTEPPACYRDAKGEIVGYNIELGRKIAAELGEKLEVEESNFDRMLPRLKAGTADMAIADIAITNARKRDVDFSEPYKFGGCAFLYPAKGHKPRMSRIASERIGCELDTMGDMYLSVHDCDPVRYIGRDDMIEGLIKGEVDAVFFDRGPLEDLAKKSRGRYLVTPLITRENYGVAISKRRPDVLKAANAVIERKEVSR